MFIYSIKAQSLKLYSSIILSVLSVILVIALIPMGNTNTADDLQVSKMIGERKFKKIETAK